MDINTLPKLTRYIQGLKCWSELSLEGKDLESLGAYTEIDGFAEVYCDFLTAVKSDTKILQLDFKLSDIELTTCASFPIFNTLCKHLPNANLVALYLPRNITLPIELLLKATGRFKEVILVVFNKGDSSELPLVSLGPDLQTLNYTYKGAYPLNAIGKLLLCIPFPSKLHYLRLSGDAVDWSDDLAISLTFPQRRRLAGIVKISSLEVLELKKLCFSDLDECTQFARALVESNVKFLTLELFTPDSENFREITNAFAAMPNLKSLEVHLHLDPQEDWNEDGSTIRDFSIPVGDIVKGSPGLDELDVCQGWKPLDGNQCQDLAMALQASTCGLKSLNLSLDRVLRPVGTVGAVYMRDLATVMSAPSLAIEVLEVDVVIVDESDVDLWLSQLPTTSLLRSLTLRPFPQTPPKLPKLQQEKLVEKVAGWYYLVGVDDCCYSDFINRGDFFKECLDEESWTKLQTLMLLNKAGRHYLTCPYSTQADGVKVLVKVRDDLDALYTHLLEDPGLCNLETVLDQQ